MRDALGNSDDLENTWIEISFERSAEIDQQ